MRMLSDVLAFAGPFVLASLGTMIGLAGLVRVNGSRSSVRAVGISRLHRVGSAATLALLAAGTVLLLAAVVLWAAHRS